MSFLAAKHLQHIEVRQSGLDCNAVASRFAAKEQDMADATLAQRLLDEDVASAAISPEADALFAERLAAEEERNSSERDEMEDMDKKLADRLMAEEQERANSIIHDKFLAATIQGEDGCAGKLLSRAVQLEDFLEAPLGSRPLPRNGDLMPETLRRIVAMSTLSNSKKSPISSPFRTTGSAIAAGVLC